MRPPCVVVGAGVSGLTCAVRLLEAGWDVTVVSRERPEETARLCAAPAGTAAERDAARFLLALAQSGSSRRRVLAQRAHVPPLRAVAVQNRAAGAGEALVRSAKSGCSGS